jgi:hypothetical protein
VGTSAFSGKAPQRSLVQVQLATNQRQAFSRRKQVGSTAVARMPFDEGKASCYATRTARLMCRVNLERVDPVHGTIASPSKGTAGNTSDNQIPLGPPMSLDGSRLYGISSALKR